MAGGAMVGYCATGRLNTDARPDNIRIMAITHAKIGRSIKKFAMKLAPCYFEPDVSELGVAACGALTPLLAPVLPVPPLVPAAPASAGAPGVLAVPPATAPPAAGGGGKLPATGLTTMPGLTLSTPLMTTRSPGFRPLSTTQLL